MRGKEIEVIKRQLDPQKLSQIKEILEALSRKDRINININFISINSPTKQPISRKEGQDEPKLLTQDEEIDIKAAIKEFGFSKSFYHKLMLKHPELKIEDSMVYPNLYLSRNRLRDYLDNNPQHRFRQRCRLGFNLPMLVARAINILREEGKQLHTNRTVPKSVRDRYLSYEQMADKMQISYNFFQTKIKPELTKKLKEGYDPQEKAKKELEAEEWARVADSWAGMNKRDVEKERLKREALEILTQLQYRRSEARMKVKRAIEESPDISSCEELVKRCV